MKKLFLGVLLTSTLATFSVKAQSDYYITTKGDTVKGIIKGSTYKQIKYRENEDVSSKKVKSAEVKEYYLGKNKESYVSLRMPNITVNIFSDNTDPIFLERLEKGKISLLRYTHTTYSGYPVPMAHTVLYWYAQKNGGPVIEIKTNQIWGSRKDRKSAFSDLLSDKPELQERYLSEDKFDYKTIQRYIQEYNL